MNKGLNEGSEHFPSVGRDTFNWLPKFHCSE
jgi:hypothetical protein